MIPILAITEAETNILIVAMPVLSAAVVLMTLILTHYRRRMQRDDMEATLKMEMIQRGMSADDIEKVLAARIGSVRRPTKTGVSGFAAGAIESAPRREG
jgi:cytochrome c-type biogenesis protein CcmH/NrfF